MIDLQLSLPTWLGRIDGKTMKRLAILIFLIFFGCTFNQTAWSQESGTAVIPGDVQEEALVFLETLASGDPDEIYSHFDLELQYEIDLGEVGDLVAAVEGKIGTIDRFELVDSGYIEDGGGQYSLSYEVEAGGRKFSYKVLLKQSGGAVAVRAFSFDSIPSPSGSRVSVTGLRLAITSLFILCIVVQIWCVVYFARKIDSKPKKWLHIFLSFLGFPVGVGLNWVSGAPAVFFGLNVPAVSVSWPLDGSAMWEMTVYFPFGAVLLIREILRKRRTGSSPDSGTVRT